MSLNVSCFPFLYILLLQKRVTQDLGGGEGRGGGLIKGESGKVRSYS